MLAVPREIIVTHLTADPDFAGRFYRLTAMLLSERLRNLIALFAAAPTKPDTKASPALLGPVRLFDVSARFPSIERIVEALPTLSQLCDGLQHGTGDRGALAKSQGTQRGMMAPEGLQLLFEPQQAKDGVNDLEKRIIRHDIPERGETSRRYLPDLWSRKR